MAIAPINTVPTMMGPSRSRIERTAPDASHAVLLYCSAGNRSAFAAKTLEDMGYEDVVSLSGGFTDWKRNGFPVELQSGLVEERTKRAIADPSQLGDEACPVDAQ